MSRSYGRPLDIKKGRIDLSHGSGGRTMAQLIEELFEVNFDNPYLAQHNDQACFEVDAGRMVMTTDGFVISPLFFPGGDIGSLAVHGTVNDVAMGGARPLYLSVGMIIEEGFPLTDLKAIVESMAAAARPSRVSTDHPSGSISSIRQAYGVQKLGSRVFEFQKVHVGFGRFIDRERA